MEPITNNNQPPQATDAASQGGGEGSTGSSVIQFPNGLDEGAVCRFTQQRNKAFQDWGGPQIDRIADLHAIFRNRPLKNEKNALPIPIGAGIVESINARLQPSLLAKPKLVEAVIDQPEIDNATREKVEAFVNQSVTQESRKPEKGKAAIKGAIIESVLIWRNLWKQEPYIETVPEQVPDPMWIPNPLDPMEQPPLVTVGETEVEKVREYWTWERKSPANVAWDPNVTTCIADSEWVRERSRMSYNQLLTWQQQGRISGVERLRHVLPSGANGKLKDDWEATLKKAEGDNYWPVSYADERCYLVEEWYARLTWETEGEVKQGDFHFFVVEGRIVINFEPNPLKPVRHPYDSCPFLVDPDSVLGLSALDQTKSLQAMVNRFSGHQDILAERAAKPLILVDATSGMDTRTAFLKPYGFQPVDNINGIKEMALDTGPMNILQGYMNWLIGLEREISGANEQMQGIEGADTATEFQGLMQAAGTRIADVTDTLQQGWIEKLALECKRFYAQFGVDGQMYARVGTEGLSTPITRAELQGNYTFTATGGASDAAKQAEVERVLQAVEIGSKLPPSPDGSVFNSQKAYVELVLPALGQKTSGDWFTQPPVPMGMPGMPPMGPEGALPTEEPAPMEAPIE